MSQQGSAGNPDSQKAETAESRAEKQASRLEAEIGLRQKAEAAKAQCEDRKLSGSDKRPESRGFKKLLEFSNPSLQGHTSSQNTCFTVLWCNQKGADDP